MRRPFTVILILCCCRAFPQATPVSDTSQFVRMDELVVTATRSERKMGNLAVPVTVVSGKTIRQSGSLRLHDILGEQTGLFVTEGFGRGVQMQGLSPDYTLVLVDGEPLIGRMGGVLDLSRITVGNIRRIEIVKGPSSSLYGSEALAGVINIITDRTESRRFSTDLRYGRFHTLDASAEAASRAGRLSWNVFGNVNSSQGYGLLPNTVQKTVEPFWRSTQQANLAYRFDERTRLSLGVRHHLEGVRNSFAVQNLGGQVLSRGTESNRDINLTPVLTHSFGERVKTAVRGYFTAFGSEQRLDVEGSADRPYNDRFRQTFARIENQTDIVFSDRMSLSAGAGLVRETVRSNRYDSLETLRTNPMGYLFLQHDWRPLERLSLISGIRFDHNSAYASVWSPKLALQYRFSDRLRMNASVGRGFKAPDFRQLYLNFTNLAAGGYAVFGSLVAAAEVERMAAAGLIEQVLPTLYRLTDLRPETSTGLNLGFQWQAAEGMSIRTNLFHNEIRDLILTDLIAYRTGGAQVFSYLNLSRVMTQGLETEASWRPIGSLTLSAGHQFLVTADRDVLEAIREGSVFKRDEETGVSSRLSRSEYAGLPGRSRHMSNLKLFWEDTEKGRFATLRLIHRSRWGVADLDGNGLINRPDEFGRGFLQVNLSAGTDLARGLRVTAGVDNLLNHRDPANLPGMPGINPYMVISLRPAAKHPDKSKNFKP